MAQAPKTFRARFEMPAAEPDEDELLGFPATDDVVDGEPMTEEQLASLVDGQINDAKNYESSDLIQLRQKALRYFEGETDVPSAQGRSKVVSRDVSDQHGLIMPSLMRVFLATDNIAIYNPSKQGDEKFARQATDYVNYVVMKECQGYIQFRSSFHDGLLMGNGPIKHWWDATPQYSTESFSGESDDAYTMVVTDPEVVEVLEHDEYPDPSWAPPPPMPMVDPMMGMGMPEEMPAPMLHDFKIKRMTSSGRLRLMSLAPEDLLLGRGVTALDEDNVRFVAHRWIKTRSELIKEGHDPELVDSLPAYTSAKLDTPEALARDRHHLYEGDVPPDRSTDLIEGYECYVQCDYDGDGVAEWRKVVTAGEGDKRTLLENEEWGDDLPFSDIVPDPVPHRWRGRSLFDSLKDIQDIKSVLMRQTLDNVYMTNTPRQFMLEGQVANPEVLESYEIGSTIIERVVNSVRYDTTPFTADKSFGILEYFDGVAEKRTGISRQTMALDPEVLQDQTATAVNATQSAISTKVEEYARNIAEHGGMERIFSKILKLIVKHQDRARTIKLRDEWVEVDPRAWNANMKVTVNTGLGSGSRERDLTMLMGIAAKQEQIILQLGPTNPVLGLDKLFDTYRLMVEAAGLKPATKFFPEIPPEIMKQMAQAASQKVDPKLQIAQMQAQFEMQKAQLDAQHQQQAEQTKAAMAQQQAQFEQQMQAVQAQREAEMQQLQFERQAQVEERQAQADIATKQAETQAKARLATQQATFQAELSRQQFTHDSALAREKFEFDKKIKLLDLWVKQRTAANKPDAEGNKPSGGEAMNVEFDNMLSSHGVEPPAQNNQGPLEQLAQALSGFGDKIAQSHEAHQSGIASVLAEIARPRRQRVVRDENNRVIGSETIQD